MADHYFSYSNDNLHPNYSFVLLFHPTGVLDELHGHRGQRTLDQQCTASSRRAAATNDLEDIQGPQAVKSGRWSVTWRCTSVCTFVCGGPESILKTHFSELLVFYIPLPILLLLSAQPVPSLRPTASHHFDMYSRRPW